MNLDKLKELEAKATPGKLMQIFPDCSHVRHGDDLGDGDWIATRFVISGKEDHSDMSDADADLFIALRNSAKEMIETIERYNAVMMLIVNNPDYTTPENMVGALRQALKDPNES